MVLRTLEVKNCNPPVSHWDRSNEALTWLLRIIRNGARPLLQTSSPLIIDITNAAAISVDDAVVDRVPIGGNDEVWFDRGTRHYFLAARNNLSNGKSDPILGSIDAATNKLDPVRLRPRPPRIRSPRTRTPNFVFLPIGFARHRPDQPVPEERLHRGFPRALRGRRGRPAGRPSYLSTDIRVEGIRPSPGRLSLPGLFVSKICGRLIMPVIGAHPHAERRHSCADRWRPIRRPAAVDPAMLSLIFGDKRTCLCPLHKFHAMISLANYALSCHRGLHCTCHDMGNAPGTVVERMQP